MNFGPEKDYSDLISSIVVNDSPFSSENYEIPAGSKMEVKITKFLLVLKWKYIFPLLLIPKKYFL